MVTIKGENMTEQKKMSPTEIAWQAINMIHGVKPYFPMHAVHTEGWAALDYLVKYIQGKLQEESQAKEVPKAASQEAEVV